ncbi:helix-turn-helix domain-containing protein [Streptococcus ovuberis]|uniref:Transposase n=1 Tax=Streptococcus ovuberis TaxID=1936207 RepID=A0A7X6S2D0_9STRE|nr:helix-turn-helix domain-containing protein [Streptococcus ovuberis]NKZ21260.1 transposase [Streptococcus ovuberis]
MSRRSPKSVEEKLELVLLYLEQGVSISTLVSSYGVAKTTIKSWIRKYQYSGVEGLKESRTWTNYNSELKRQHFFNNLFSSLKKSLWLFRLKKFFEGYLLPYFEPQKSTLPCPEIIHAYFKFKTLTSCPLQTFLDCCIT